MKPYQLEAALMILQKLQGGPITSTAEADEAEEVAGAEDDDGGEDDDIGYQEDKEMSDEDIFMSDEERERERCDAKNTKARAQTMTKATGSGEAEGDIPAYHGAILADEMGLGKTLTAISIMFAFCKGGRSKAIVVAPSGVVR
jgi:hypothetical protein